MQRVLSGSWIVQSSCESLRCDTIGELSVSTWIPFKEIYIYIYIYLYIYIYIYIWERCCNFQIIRFAFFRKTNSFITHQIQGFGKKQYCIQNLHLEPYRSPWPNIEKLSLRASFSIFKLRYLSQEMLSKKSLGNHGKWWFWPSRWSKRKFVFNFDLLWARKHCQWRLLAVVASARHTFGSAPVGFRRFQMVSHVSYDIISYDIVSYGILSYDIISYDMRSSDMISCGIVWYHVIV